MNNSYLGLIRQAQGGFDMDHHVQLFVENINAPELGGYGVDHVAVAEGLGCKAIRHRSKGRAGGLCDGARSTGEINYPFLFRHLDAIGYRGWIGCEYKPRAVDSLGWHAALTVDT